MISVIITTLNEKDDILNNTISSLRKNSDYKLEIIVVDDASEIPCEIQDKSVILQRNQYRMGVGRSRHIGATLAKNRYLLFTDAHMTFRDDWYKNTLKRIEGKNSTLYCGTCMGLDDGEMDLSKTRGAYHGARLSLFDEKENQVLEGKWIENRPNEDDYELSCIMGAIYLIPRDFFFKIRGLSDIKMWGSDEPCLAIKTWLAGGDVRMAKSIVAGHQFRSSSPYSTQLKFLIYNKIRLCLELFPDELARILIAKIPQDANFFAACQMIKQDKREIDEYKKYYQSIFVRDINWMCEKFGIKKP